MQNRYNPKNARLRKTHRSNGAIFSTGVSRRLTEVVPFAPITQDVAKQIFELHFSRLKEMLFNQKNISVSLDESALEYLVKKGYSPKYGARPIAGVIRTYLKKTISRLIVSEKIKSGDNVIVKFFNNELRWELA